ncbi:hypothetical protein RclHR1_23900001, partial [Rhizophagus clarus]
SFLSFGRAQSPFQTLFQRLEILNVKEQPWTLYFEGSGTPFQGGLLSPELHSRWTTLSPELHFEVDYIYDISKVRKFFIGGLLSGTPLGADYDILKIQTFHFEDWTLFEDLVTIFEDYFEGPDEAQTPFKDPGR